MVLGGNIIVTIGGRAVPNAEAFLDAMKALHVGQWVLVEIMRNGEHLDKSILAGKRPGSHPARHAAGRSRVG